MFYPGIFLLLALFCCQLHAQLDPEKRRLIQLGYNQSLEGRGPIAAYGFYYYNNPDFLTTNMTLRLAVAPIYLDAELGFKGLLSPNTDVAVGLAGGGFADSYSEVRRGRYIRGESFTGHGGETSVSLYHRFNPEDRLPLWAIVRATVHRTIFEEDTGTDDGFILPMDRTDFHVRSGFRLGGQAPTMTDPLALELAAFYEGQFRTDSGNYGFASDRRVEDDSHLFWGRGLLKYTFVPSLQWFQTSLTAGTSLNADRFSAYRLGGFLPFTSEFPLNLPGYYFQELSAESFTLLNGQYAIPIDPNKQWEISAFAGTGWVDYLDDLKQPGTWHSGAGIGLTWTSPTTAWMISLFYAHGFDAIRNDERGANSVGFLLQYDFEAKKHRLSRFEPGISPYKSRGAERLLFQ